MGRIWGFQQLEGQGHGALDAPMRGWHFGKSLKAVDRVDSPIENRSNRKRRALPFLLALAALVAAPLCAHAQEEKAEAESAEGFSWERPEEGIAFSTRIAGRRIPDYLRELMQNARSLKPDARTCSTRSTAGKNRAVTATWSRVA